MKIFLTQFRTIICAAAANGSQLHSPFNHHVEPVARLHDALLRLDKYLILVNNIKIDIKADYEVKLHLVVSHVEDLLAGDGVEEVIGLEADVRRQTGSGHLHGDISLRWVALCFC